MKDVTCLGDIVEKGFIKLCTGPFGSALHKHEYRDSGVSVVPAEAIADGNLDTSKYNFVGDEKAKELKRYKLSEGDIVFARRGAQACGCSALVKKDDNAKIAGTGLIFIKVLEPEKINPYFLFLAVSNEQSLSWLKAHAIGATMPNLNGGILKSLPLLVPAYEQQLLMVAQHRPLSSKIILNRQINQTLEQIAQALFKSWFVDFEPTRAKVAAKKSGQDPECAAMAAISGKTVAELGQLDAAQLAQLKTTAAFFPDGLVESELGEVPDGWEIKSLDEIAHYQNGLALQKFRPEDENDFLPVLKIAQLKKGFADGIEKASPNIKPSCIVDNGDVVFSWSGSLVVDIWCGGKVALNQHLFKVTSSEYPKWFYYYWTKHHLEVFQQIAADKAVTMGHIKRSHLAEAKCAVPHNELDNSNLIHSLLEKQIKLRLEAISLQTIRDTLLPKLLSGELSPAQAEVA